MALLRTHQMSPDLLFHPVLDIPKAAAGVSNPKVVHPSSQDRINQIYNPIYRLRVESTKHFLEFSEQGSSGLHPWRDPNSPLPSPGSNPPKGKPKKTE
jgi:hypothetical protein